MRHLEWTFITLAKCIMGYCLQWKAMMLSKMLSKELLSIFRMVNLLTSLFSDFCEVPMSHSTQINIRRLEYIDYVERTNIKAFFLDMCLGFLQTGTFWNTFWCFKSTSTYLISLAMWFKGSTVQLYLIQWEESLFDKALKWNVKEKEMLGYFSK